MVKRGTMDICQKCGELKEVYIDGKCSTCYHREYRNKPENIDRLRANARRWYHRNKQRHAERQERYRVRKAKGLVNKP